jgi:hypothetical protein
MIFVSPYYVPLGKWSIFYSNFTVNIFKFQKTFACIYLSINGLKDYTYVIIHNYNHLQDFNVFIFLYPRFQAH